MAEETVDNSQADAADESTGAAAEESAGTTAESAVAAGEAAEGAAESTEDEVAGGDSEADAAAAEPEAAAPAEALTEALKPDIKFVRQVMASGGSDLKKCYQCATCSVVCNVTPDDHPFPRKEMQYAQWGLKDKLMGSPDIWLCHQCSDCVAQCPRDAKPGNVMQAIAKMTLSSYSAPGFMAQGVGAAKSFLLMLAIPVIIVLIAIAATGHLTNIPLGHMHEGACESDCGDIVFNNFMPVLTIQVLYTLIFLFAAVTLIAGGRKYWAAMKANDGPGAGSVSFMSNLGPTVTEFLAHKRFKECDETENRQISHLFVFYGFVALAITTAWALLYADILGMESPYGIANPVKWLANIGAVATLLGIILVMIYRSQKAERVGIGSYYDWLFIGVIFTIILSGLLAEIFRMAEIGAIAYPSYFVHLVAIMFLFLYAPYSKMAHMIYRATALVYARATGRDTGIES